MALLHELYERRDALGFTLLDRAGLARLAAAIPDHQKRQTPLNLLKYFNNVAPPNLSGKYAATPQQYATQCYVLDQVIIALI
ncbi:Uncharacterised protein [Serratia fonticola]|uniref:Uncharacterized protein n=1 Tax=Serratia fonticola TaxID=47917 RepID=A0A4U9W3Q5_SERFO|nr:Uncharacterised protein [Serratia fonticola]